MKQKVILSSLSKEKLEKGDRDVENKEKGKVSFPWQIGLLVALYLVIASMPFYTIKHLNFTYSKITILFLVEKNLQIWTIPILRIPLFFYLFFLP